MEIKIGDIIKSYDFAYNTRSYSIGQVTEIVDEYIFFTCIKQVWENEMVDPKEYDPSMRTVAMGCLMSDERFARIEVLG